MKRRHSCELTLWTAAKLKGYNNFESWYKSFNEPKMGKGNTLANLHSRYRTSKEETRTEKKELMSTCCIGLRPTGEQRRVLNLMLRVSNTAYNWCNFLVTEKNMEPSQFTLQKIVAKRYSKDLDSSHIHEQAKWLFDDDIGLTQHRGLACKSYVANYNSVKSLYKKGHQRKRGVIKDKATSKNIQSGSFSVQKLFINKPTTNSIEQAGYGDESHYILLTPGCFKRHGAETFLRLSRPLPFAIEHDCTISKRARSGKWVLNIPCHASQIRKPVKQQNDICGIDPGCRAMLTVFDESNHHAYQMGTDDDYKRLKNLRWYAKHYAVEAADCTKKKQHVKAEHFRRACGKLWDRVACKLKYLHDKFKRHLIANYGLISFGNLGVSKVVGNRLPKKAKDRLHQWSIYKFRESLLHRARGTDVQVVVEDEAYTSQTCSECRQRTKVGARETFCCKSNKCQFTTNRDVNAAKNILFRTLQTLFF